MTRVLAFVLALGWSFAAHAESPAIAGTYGFDWLLPKKSKCSEVKGPLLTRLTKSYACAPPATESASGVKVVAVCKALRARSELMLFSTVADCRKERETQLANGD